jgi:putative MATE family efflux protein
MNHSLTQGPITRNMLLFALPLMLGNLLQQMYNLADAWVVGRFLGPDALAAVGSSYTLMTFLTSILLGLCMGSGAAISMQYGAGQQDRLRRCVFLSFGLIAVLSLVLNGAVYLGMDGILWVLRVPAEIRPLMQDYLAVVFLGILATFLYNYYASLLRAIGNSVVPLVFLAVSAVLNVVLDLGCVVGLGWGVKGAALATVAAQFVSGIGIAVYAWRCFPQLRPRREDCRWDRAALASILNLSVMTSVQQSIMNFGILMVQGLVNSFGPVTMAAFAAAVKIDSFAYLPVQDFGNAFSTFVAQNHGAHQPQRIRQGIRSAGAVSAVFCLVISGLVCVFAAPLMSIFIDPAQTQIIQAGVHYLRIEGACYIGIGVLFLLYGYYRAVERPAMSVVLTIASLGTRVALAYALSATALGVTGIWLSVPIGWALADGIGIGYYFFLQKQGREVRPGGTS